jgi:hypothetical protein
LVRRVGVEGMSTMPHQERCQPPWQSVLNSECLAGSRGLHTLRGPGDGLYLTVPEAPTSPSRY